VAIGGGPWWLGAAGVSGYGACLARVDSDNDWLFLARVVDFFLFGLYILVFSQCIFAMG
jgi:hypothetical protein